MTSPRDPQKEPRTPRRVQWQPEGAVPDTGFVDVSEENTAEDWSERQLSNDEQLKRDKPPHWG